MISLYDYQKDAISRMKNGCILCGSVGSGKSRTSLAYYYICQGGKPEGTRIPGKPKDLYIITTARKRDTHEWEDELSVIPMSENPEVNPYDNKVVIDSWNNIKKYVGVKGAFFIFDEQRVVGSGVWVKSFLKITEKNEWILLSATPGDTWSDYVPVFIANGYFKNKTEFNREHAIFSRFSKFPKIERYINTGILIKYKNSILVNMEYERRTKQNHVDILVDYDRLLYKRVKEELWDVWNDKPLKTASELCLALRKVVNSDQSRSIAVLEIFEKHPKMIIFYNFNYELDILRNLYYGEDVEIAEWNGHKHEELPKSEKWVYLVQYNAGAEGWNCITTDTILFYSQNYSYKITAQASGRIDRLNTPFNNLYYYHMRSSSAIDISIKRALDKKKTFNENVFCKKYVDKMLGLC